ncbi:MAG: dTDP-4-dehydrorhamnose reductase [Negativicutes bacterium]|jgi:dTDP-4-dehydrorhamnose reductase
MKILITGCNGQLGRELQKQLITDELILTDIHNLDITDWRAVKETFAVTRPQAVVHCAAYTAVDKAEVDIDGAFSVNVVGSQNIAAASLEIGARMVCVSTDYVFDGENEGMYREFDATNPQSVYGKTKLQGEQIVKEILGRHYIARTAWLYGDGNNFIRTMLKLAETNAQLKVVNDQTGSPTSACELAKAIDRLIRTDAYGTYHCTCQGQTTWYELTKLAFEIARVKTVVNPCTTSEFPRPAKRPRHSVLDNYMLRMAIGDPMGDWQSALKEYLKCELGNED